MSSDTKSNNPFRNQAFQPNGAEPSQTSAGYPTTTAIAGAEPSSSNPNQISGLEDLSIQPGDPRLQTFYATLPDGPPPAYDGLRSSQSPVDDEGGYTKSGLHKEKNAEAMPSTSSPEASSSRSPEARGGMFTFFRYPGSNNTPIPPPTPANIPIPMGEPPSFLRPPPTNLSYAPFPSTYLISIGKRLEQGFPLLPPPSDIQPHPFVTHDVNEGDWTWCESF
jgi:Domain of unknown function (DUF4646)